jgi:cardiolipin synthase A/B
VSPGVSAPADRRPPRAPRGVLADTARDLAAVRVMADQAFSRAAGAPLVHGNTIRLLKDGAENYPAWLARIAEARESIHFECYIVHDDDVGLRFADALIARARDGVRVRVIYDWLGGFATTRGRYWRRLREGGVEVRCFNPPRLDEPLGWVARDHRKSMVVDARTAFVTGLCIGKAWEGSPERGLEPWRDTGVEIRGPAVADVSRAFAEAWAACGEPLPEAERTRPLPAREGDVPLRVVAATSGTSGLYRLDPLVAALARSTLWLTDAYYAGTPSYVQALGAAARDGVDVRLLVPGRGSDLAIMQAISRAGYRPLLEAGVRVFEWNGTMLHAKTAVADARWSRVGSTNLNPASWMGNWELDVVVEDERFGHAMEAMYVDDLANATEVLLERRRRVRPVDASRTPRRRGSGGGGTRAAAGALRIGNAIGSALVARHVTGPAEQRLLVHGGLILAVVAVVAALWPPVLAWPLGLLSLWLALALLLRAARPRSPSSAPVPADRNRPT